MRRMSELVEDSLFSALDEEDEEEDDEEGDDREEEEEDAEYSEETESSLDSTSVTGKQSTREVLQDEVQAVHKLARRETENVRMWRLLVLLIILVTGAVVSSLTYFTLRGAQKSNYEENYYLVAETIRGQMQSHATNLLGSFRRLSEQITANAITTGSKFPTVTVSTYEVQARNTRNQTGVELILFAPIVTDLNRPQWEEYAVANQIWLDISRRVVLNQRNATLNETNFVTGNITEFIHEIILNERGWGSVPASGPGPYGPLWHASPPPFEPATVNYNLFHSFDNVQLFHVVRRVKEAVFSGAVNSSSLLGVEIDTFLDKFVQNRAHLGGPRSILMQPVFEKMVATGSAVGGVLQAIVPWDQYLVDVLPVGVNGIILVLKNTCGQAYTYEILNRHQVIFHGEGDLHDQRYSRMGVVVPFNDYLRPNTTAQAHGHCQNAFHVYPTSAFEQSFETQLPVILPWIVSVAFCVMAIAFVMYDRFAARRNRNLIEVAAQSNAIVSSMFPSQFRDQLIGQKQQMRRPRGAGRLQAPKNRLRNFLNGDGPNTKLDGDDVDIDSRPIADLFTETTVLFADIAGFTAWSSVREPCQVFSLLETIYHAFDEIARRRRVFKVETVGDCYVAVCGLPEPRKDHSVVMCRFSRDCMFRMQRLTRRLEVTLGPDTGDLCMRMGIHSGPVTAGVLRGERSRFQLFGDTMNTASRMESTGLPGRIQCSQDTVDLLIASGKERWIVSRQEKVVAKGKGELQTYWLTLEDRPDMAPALSASDEASVSQAAFSEMSSLVDDGFDPKIKALVSGKLSRLIDWNTEVLLRLLKQIVAHRNASRTEELDDPAGTHRLLPEGQSMLDEVKEIINLPEFDAEVAKREEDAELIQLDTKIVSQLHDYIGNIAAMYRENPFHNFEHASHVTMSVCKLLSRIVAPSDIDVEVDSGGMDSFLQDHNHTYGITSDPLTQFACVFSALIHDCDHPGVPNSQLVKEETKIAKFYKGKSVAEQNSVDLAFDFLMEEEFAELRAVIFATESERKRFRSLVVNSVMATDIMDKDLKKLRNARWEKAFALCPSEEDPRDQVNRKATIVIEHLIQASDVAHTMQHWHIYRKWNERLYLEMYKAFKRGRSANDPTDGWYQGEIGFFNFYIIPLAKKLKDCGVFGVSCDEYLNYAIHNRDEWEARGQEVVSEMKERVDAMERKQVALHVARHYSNKGHNKGKRPGQPRSSSLSVIPDGQVPTKEEMSVLPSSHRRSSGPSVRMC